MFPLKICFCRTLFDDCFYPNNYHNTIVIRTPREEIRTTKTSKSGAIVCSHFYHKLFLKNIKKGNKKL